MKIFSIQLNRIIRWVTEECDTMKEKAGDKLQSIIIDMSSENLYFNHIFYSLYFLLKGIEITTSVLYVFASPQM